MKLREKLLAALQKPIAKPDDGATVDDFDPWSDVIEGIYGSYSSESDLHMINALIAVQERTTFELIQEHGFIAEFCLYVLAGHGLIDYGTSPRGGFPDSRVADLFPALISKWIEYYETTWEESFPSPPTPRA